MLVSPILNIAKLFGSLLVHWRMQSAPEVSMRWPPTPLRPSDPLPTRQPGLLLGCRAPLLSCKPDCARAWMSSVVIDAGAKIGREYSPSTFTQLPRLSRAVLLTAAANSTIFVFPAFLFNSALALQCAYLAARSVGQDMEWNDEG